MLNSGILNSHLLSLLAKVRHTNTIAIVDCGFPNWPGVEVVDISLTRGIPTVLEAFDLIRPVFTVGKIWQAEEFLQCNSEETVNRFAESLKGLSFSREPHAEFKGRVPGVIGLIRTGDPTPYANLIFESA